MAVGLGFEYFYDLWAARPINGRPFCTVIIHRSSVLDRPGYNLITDMADEAVKHMRDLNSAAPDKHFSYYVPAALTLRTSDQGMDREV